MENNESTPRTPLLRSSKEQPVSAQKIIVPRQQSSSKSTCSKSTQVSRAPSNSDHPTSSVTTTTQAFDWLHEGGHFPQQQLLSAEQQDVMHLGSWAAIDGAYNTSHYGDTPASDMLRIPPGFVDPSTAILSFKSDPPLTTGLREMSQDEHEDQAIALLRASLHYGC